MVRPVLTKDGVDVRLRESFPRWKRPHHLGEDEASAALASRPLDDAAVPPEGPQLPHLVGSRIPVGDGHDSL